MWGLWQELQALAPLSQCSPEAHVGLRRDGLGGARSESVLVLEADEGLGAEARCL